MHKGYSSLFRDQQVSFWNASRCSCGRLDARFLILTRRDPPRCDARHTSRRLNQRGLSGPPRRLQAVYLPNISSLHRQPIFRSRFRSKSYRGDCYASCNSRRAHDTFLPAAGLTLEAYAQDPSARCVPVANRQMTIASAQGHGLDIESFSEPETVGVPESVQRADARQQLRCYENVRGGRGRSCLRFLRKRQGPLRRPLFPSTARATMRSSSTRRGTARKCYRAVPRSGANRTRRTNATDSCSPHWSPRSRWWRTLAYQSYARGAGGFLLTRGLRRTAIICGHSGGADPQVITVEANEEYAARTDALLEARRTSGSCKPWWEPAPPTVISHARLAADFAVIKVEPLFQREAQEVRRPESFAEEHVEAAAKALQAEWRREDTSAATGTRGLLP